VDSLCLFLSNTVVFTKYGGADETVPWFRGARDVGDDDHHRRMRGYRRGISRGVREGYDSDTS